VVAVLLERDAEIAAAEQQAEPSDVDTDDEAHEAPEYDAWQARELSRVSRDRAEREAAFKEREELERLRAMTDEEREEWDRAHPPPVSAAQAARDSAKWAFMQKYYHKGAFFQTGADDKFGTIGTFDIYTRDFGAATGEDKGVDRSTLPKARTWGPAWAVCAALPAALLHVGCACVCADMWVAGCSAQAMQVKKGLFGRAGQVKWTHLAAEDTSRKRDDTWGQDPSMRDKCACGCALRIMRAPLLNLAASPLLACSMLPPACVPAV
jgi:microfibrillar-associated protein 1